MSKETLELNTVYERDLGDLSHGTLTHEEMIDHYTNNSSPLSFLMEKQLEKWFDNLEYNPKQVKIPFKDKHITIKPDLRGTRKNTIYDQKAFNRNGGSFSRSSMKGFGRTYIKEENDAWASAQVFIWTDHNSLPKIRIIALTGEECMKRWPTSKISFKDREKLFTGAK
jgi:hypothetical protein